MSDPENGPSHILDLIHLDWDPALSCHSEILRTNLEMSRPGVQRSAGEGEAVSSPNALEPGFAEGQDAADDEFDAFLRVILPYFGSYWRSSYRAISPASARAC